MDHSSISESIIPKVNLANKVLTLEKTVIELKNELLELKNEFHIRLSSILQENQELKWATHEKNGDCISLEDSLSD